MFDPSGKHVFAGTAGGTILVFNTRTARVSCIVTGVGPPSHAPLLSWLGDTTSLAFRASNTWRLRGQAGMVPPVCLTGV